MKWLEEIRFEASTAGRRCIDKKGSPGISTREKVLANLAASRASRKSSNFTEYMVKEKAVQFAVDTGKGPTKLCVLYDKKTKKWYYGKSGFQYTPEEWNKEIVTSLKEAENAALKEDPPKFSKNGKPSMEIWDPDNCAELRALNEALTDGAVRENLIGATIIRKSKEFINPCNNCRITCKGVKFVF